MKLRSIVTFFAFVISLNIFSHNLFAMEAQPPAGDDHAQSGCAKFMACCRATAPLFLAVGTVVVQQTAGTQIRDWIETVRKQNPAAFAVLIALANNQAVEQATHEAAKAVLQPCGLMMPDGTISPMVTELVKALVPLDLAPARGAAGHHVVRVLTIKQALKQQRIAHHNG